MIMVKSHESQLFCSVILAVQILEGRCAKHLLCVDDGMVWYGQNVVGRELYVDGS